MMFIKTFQLYGIVDSCGRFFTRTLLIFTPPRKNFTVGITAEIAALRDLLNGK